MFSEQFFFLNLDPLCGPVAAKPLVLELLCLEVGTSVAFALTAETIFEIVKCIADVDMRAHGVKTRNFQVFQFWLRPRWKYVEFSTSGIPSNRKHVN